MINPETIGIGPTDELSLRVSVASLARVVFADPENGRALLALERKATLPPAEGNMTVKAQPFGGALRIHDLLPLKKLTGDFHFDSQRSRSERDFRIYIRPSAWGAVREFCQEQFRSSGGTALESGPDRELVEEFGDILSVDLSPVQYRCSPLWTILENEPIPSGNVHAEGQSTVRLYRVFEVPITDSDLMKAMILSSHNNSERELGKLARENARKGGKGWANAMLILPLDQLGSFYQAMSDEQRDFPTRFNGFFLEPNVTTLLEGVLASKYQLLV